MLHSTMPAYDSIILFHLSDFLFLYIPIYKFIIIVFSLFSMLSIILFVLLVSELLSLEPILPVSMVAILAKSCDCKLAGSCEWFFE